MGRFFRLEYRQDVGIDGDAEAGLVLKSGQYRCLHRGDDRCRQRQENVTTCGEEADGPLGWGHSCDLSGGAKVVRYDKAAKVEIRSQHVTDHDL